MVLPLSFQPVFSVIPAKYARNVLEPALGPSRLVGVSGGARSPGSPENFQISRKSLLALKASYRPKRFRKLRYGGGFVPVLHYQSEFWRFHPLQSVLGRSRNSGVLQSPESWTTSEKVVQANLLKTRVLDEVDYMDYQFALCSL